MVRSRTISPLFAVLTFLLLFCTSLSAAFSWESLQLKNAVNDYAGILSRQDAATLEQQLRAYQQGSGNAFVLLVLPDLDGGDIDDAANRIFERAGIGQKGKDNGVLLLVAMKEHALRIEVGYGLEPMLTDVICKSIIQTDITPAFRSGNYAAGLSDAFERMEKIAGGDTSAIPEEHGENTQAPISFLVIFLLFILFSIFGGRRGRRRIYRSGPFIITGGGGFGGGGFGGGFGGGGGGFGGFGGGMSGGGGASGGW